MVAESVVGGRPAGRERFKARDSRMRQPAGRKPDRGLDRNCIKDDRVRDTLAFKKSAASALAAEVLPLQGDRRA